MTLRILLFLAAISGLPAQASEPEFRSGDVIFQTSNSQQSQAILFASDSLYSHVGIVEVSDQKKYVLEAIAKVSRTPLEAWIKRGRSGKYALYRLGGLDEEKQKNLIANAKQYLGFGYDVFFTSHNKEIYCSELVSLAFQKAGQTVGKFEKVKNLNVDNKAVQQLVQKRWRGHPLCKSGIKKFEDCWAKILDDELVTPESVANDSQLTKIFSNYP